MNAWDELGIAATADLRQIKLAYAARLKQVHPEDDAEGFQRLRGAYEWALGQAQARAARPPQAPPGPPRQVAAHTAPEPVAPPQHRDAAPPAHRAADEAALPQTAAPPRGEPLPQRPAAVHPAPAARALPPLPHELPPPPPPAQAAQQLLALVLAAAPRDRDTALKSALRARGWENLDFQAAVERAVMQALLADFDANFPVIRVFAGHYGWQARERRVKDADPQLSMLLARESARRRRLELAAEQPHAGPLRRTAFLLLCGPVDEAAFTRFARWRKNLRMMASLLGDLQARDPAVLRYELNAAAVDWWRKHLAGRPRTVEDQIRFAFFCILFAPVAGGLLVTAIEDQAGYDLHKHPALLVLLYVACLLGPFAIRVGLQRWRRRAWSTRVLAARQRWRHEPLRRRWMLLLTGLALVLSAGAGTVPALGAFAALAVLLLWFWTSLAFAASALVVLAWPLHLAIAAPVALLFETAPALARHFAAPPLLVFPHLAAAYLVQPFTRLTERAYQRLFGRRLKDPGRGAFYAGIAVAVFVAIAAAAFDSRLSDHASYQPPTVVRRPIPSYGPAATPGQSADSFAALTGLPPAPAPAPQHRPAQDLQRTYDRNKARFDATFAQYFRNHPAVVPGRLAVQFLIGPGGDVLDAHVASSTYGDPGFEARIVSQVRNLKFAAEPSGETVTATYVWGLKSPAGSPLPSAQTPQSATPALPQQAPVNGLQAFAPKATNAAAALMPAPADSKLSFRSLGRGSWSALETYQPGDTVIYQGKTWTAQMQSTGQAPGSGMAWSAR